METVMAFVVGGLYAAGLYMMLRRDVIRLVMGLGLVSHATNLLIFTSGGLTRGRPPLVPEGLDAPVGAFANPLPQALILTAIVIGFGLQAFALVLADRTVQHVGTDDVDHLTTTDTDV